MLLAAAKLCNLLTQRIDSRAELGKCVPVQLRCFINNQFFKLRERFANDGKNELTRVPSPPLLSAAQNVQQECHAALGTCVPYVPGRVLHQMRSRQRATL